MSDLNIEWQAFSPPNMPLLQTKLPDYIMDYLWERIEQAKADNIPWGDRLAGNISSSLLMYDIDNYFLDNVIGPVTERLVNDNPRTLAPSFHESMFEEWNFKFKMNMWVNFQKQTEFNPVHAHSGCTSFVIWMKIPTDPEEQHNLDLPFKTDAASDFAFEYTNILGEPQTMTVPMSKEMEGVMAVFPSKLRHSVCPFYSCDEDRISISGNLLWDISPKNKD